MMRAPKKAIGLLCAFAILVHLTLTQNNFCYGSFRFFSERQIVDKFLFGDEFLSLKDEEKRSLMEDRVQEYPNNCRVYGTYTIDSLLFRYLNFLAGRKLHQVDCVSRKASKEGLEKFKYREYAVTSCGQYAYFIGGDDLSASAYQQQLKSNQSYWESR